MCDIKRWTHSLDAAVTGNEPIFADGRCIGQITSGNFGYSVGKYIAFGYVPVRFSAVETSLEIDYLGKRFDAIVGNDSILLCVRRGKHAIEELILPPFAPLREACSAK